MSYILSRRSIEKKEDEGNWELMLDYPFDFRWDDLTGNFQVNTAYKTLAGVNFNTIGGHPCLFCPRANSNIMCYIAMTKDTGAQEYTAEKWQNKWKFSIDVSLNARIDYRSIIDGCGSGANPSGMITQDMGTSGWNIGAAANSTYERLVPQTAFPIGTWINES
jgi:hypothetical protein